MICSLGRWSIPSLAWRIGVRHRRGRRPWITPKKAFRFFERGSGGGESQRGPAGPAVGLPPLAPVQAVLLLWLSTWGGFERQARRQPTHAKMSGLGDLIRQSDLPLDSRPVGSRSKDHCFSCAVPAASLSPDSEPFRRLRETAAWLSMFCTLFEGPGQPAPCCPPYFMTVWGKVTSEWRRVFLLAQSGLGS